MKIESCVLGAMGAPLGAHDGQAFRIWAEEHLAVTGREDASSEAVPPSNPPKLRTPEEIQIATKERAERWLEMAGRH